MKSFHEDAGALWREAGRASPAPTGPEEPDPGRAWLLKSEPRVRILLSAAGADGTRAVSKVYRTPSRLAWRTLFMTSRARREFHNLRYAFDRGLDVVEPLGWSDTRRLGCVRYNQLTMRWMPGVNLIAYLKLPGQPAAARDAAVIGTGRLLANMHRSGIAWGTALPRNVMVRPAGTAQDLPRVAAFDLPYAWCGSGDLTGGRSALIDLWWMADDWLTRPGFDERLLDLLYAAYCGEAGEDPQTLRRRVEAVGGTQRRLHRFGLRIVQAFRLNR